MNTILVALSLFCEIGSLPPGVSDTPVICIPHPDVDAAGIDGVRVWMRRAPGGEWHSYDLPAVPVGTGSHRMMPGLCPCSSTAKTRGVQWPLARLSTEWQSGTQVDVSAAFYKHNSVVDPPDELTEPAEILCAETGEWGAVPVCWNRYRVWP